jgi:Mg2+ and Co2+ transporter CorA
VPGLYGNRAYRAGLRGCNSFRMTRILFLLLSVFVLHSPARGQKFTGQVYLLAEKFLVDKCAVLVEGNACSTDLIFLTDKKFAMVYHCLLNSTYYTGNYRKTKDRLNFIFKQVMVTEVYDAEKDKKTYDKKKLSLEPIEFTIIVCEAGKVTLEHNTIKDYKNGSRVTSRTAREKTTRLKISRAWKMISG